MAGLDALGFSDTTKEQEQSTASHLLDECMSFGSGVVKGIRQAFHEDIVQNPGNTAFKATMVAGGMFLLGGIQGTSRLAVLGLEAVAAGSAMTALSELGRSNSADGAGEKVGRMLFDTGVYGLAGLGGGLAGRAFKLTPSDWSVAYASPSMSSFDRLMMAKSSERHW